MKFKKYHESRNLLPSPVSATVESAGITIESSGDGIINVSGTRTSGASPTINLKESVTFNGTYYVHLRNNVAAPSSTIVLRNGTTSIVNITLTSTNLITQITISNVTIDNIQVYVTSGTSINAQMAISIEQTESVTPYEPYSSEVWHDTPHYIHNTSTDTLTTLPAVLYPNAATATVGLKGQAVQSSVPSPTSPVMPQGTGNKTANLFDSSTLANDYTLNATTGLPYSFPKRIATLTPIDVSTLITVTLSYQSEITNTMFIYAVLNGSTLISRVASNHSGDIIDVSGGDKLYISFYSQPDNITIDKVSNIILNSGSTALPYEPYGVKIPISSADTTTNNYLGEVETTRKIKKLVLTGEEDNWKKSTTYQGSFYNALLDTPAYTIPILCSHAVYIQQITPTTYVYGKCTVDGSGSIKNLNLFIGEPSWSVSDFQQYLAQQYANGTPVCVWYVLATEETAVVNEPLMRIGDYADTLSGISIPVTAGGDTLSVGTTVQPSEVTVNYKGWHPVQSVHEKSKNLLPPPSQEQSGTLNGITYYVHADGSVDLSGIAEANVTINIDLANEFTIPVSTSQGGGGTIALNNSFTNSSSITLLYNSTVIDSWGFSTPNRTSTSYSAMANKTINRYSIGIVSGTNLSSGGKVGLAFSNNGTPVTPYQPYWK